MHLHIPDLQPGGTTSLLPHRPRGHYNHSSSILPIRSAQTHFPDLQPSGTTSLLHRNLVSHRYLGNNNPPGGFVHLHIPGLQPGGTTSLPHHSPWLRHCHYNSILPNHSVLPQAPD